MKDKLGCDRNVQDQSTQHGMRGQVLWLLILMLSIFMLFHIELVATHNINMEHTVNNTRGQAEPSTQVILHSIADNLCIIFNSENEIKETKKRTVIPWISLVVILSIMIFDYQQYGKTKWLKSLFIIKRYLVMIIYYIIQSDGKKRYHRLA